jgi:cholesterol oxidase
MVPANLGVNPSLTITALTERAMSFISKKEDMQFFKFEKKWKITSVIDTQVANKQKSSVLVKNRTKKKN